jgi:transporter family-2 protein
MVFWFGVILAVVAGCCMPIQAGVNSQLGKILGHPWQAALISFVTGAFAMFVICLATGQAFPSYAKLVSIPWYLFLGGVLGAVLVVTAIFFAPYLGATVLVVSIITGQLILSVLIDHYGWVGFPVHPISPGRIVGIVCLVAGIILVKVF